MRYTDLSPGHIDRIQSLGRPSWFFHAAALSVCILPSFLGVGRRLSIQVKYYLLIRS